MDFLIIFGLILLCIGLLVWVMLLDTRVEQLKGYIKRLEQNDD